MMSVKLSSSGIAMLIKNSASRSAGKRNDSAQAIVRRNRSSDGFARQSRASAIATLTVAGFLFDRSHRHVRDPAGSDLIEGREVATHVEGETVHRDPMPNADADRGDLAICSTQTPVRPARVIASSSNVASNSISSASIQRR